MSRLSTTIKRTSIAFGMNLSANSAWASIPTPPVKSCSVWTCRPIKRNTKSSLNLKNLQRKLPICKGITMTDNNLPQAANFILYTAANGDINLNVALRDETVWLTQKAMADLFAVGVPAINKHLKNI